MELLAITMIIFSAFSLGLAVFSLTVIIKVCKGVSINVNVTQVPVTAPNNVMSDAVLEQMQKELDEAAEKNKAQNKQFDDIIQNVQDIMTGGNTHG